MFNKLKGLLGGQAAEQPAAADDLNGAYRQHDGEEAEKLTQLAREAFPEFADRISCFGSDWLGRIFATDSGRLADGQELVLMLEPGTGEALEIPCGKEEFHFSEIVECADAAIALGFFRQWLTSGGAVPSRQQCVSYKQPLFLGGADEVHNLEIMDMEVYWTITGQLLDQARGLPSGTRIGRVTISD